MRLFPLMRDYNNWLSEQEEHKHLYICSNTLRMLLPSNDNNDI